MTSPSSDPLAMYALRSERVTLPASCRVREVDSRSLALPAVRHSSMTRKALKALGRVVQAVAQESETCPQPSPTSRRLAAPST